MKKRKKERRKSNELCPKTMRLELLTVCSSSTQTYDKETHGILSCTLEKVRIKMMHLWKKKCIKMMHLWKGIHL